MDEMVRGAGVRDPGGLVVYTCVFGEGYGLPDVEGPGERLCFTDRDDLEPRGWTVVRVDPLLPGDSARSSREQKIRPHRWLQGYDRSIYVDPSVELQADPEKLWTWLVGDDPRVWFGALLHSERETVLEEFGKVLDYGFDATERLHEHLRALVLNDPGGLERKPVWGAILARRHHDPRSVTAMEDWFAQVLRYSRRDQLSLPGVLSRCDPDGLHLVVGNNRGDGLHTWPRPGYQKPSRYTATINDELVPAILRAEQESARRLKLEDEVATLRAELTELRATQAAAELRLRDLGRSLSSSEAALAKTQRQRDRALRQRDAVRSSRTWRWTRVVRRSRPRTAPVEPIDAPSERAAPDAG